MVSDEQHDGYVHPSRSSHAIPAKRPGRRSDHLQTPNKNDERFSLGSSRTTGFNVYGCSLARRRRTLGSRLGPFHYDTYATMLVEANSLRIFDTLIG